MVSGIPEVRGSNLKPNYNRRKKGVYMFQNYRNSSIYLYKKQHGKKHTVTNTVRNIYANPKNSESVYLTEMVHDPDFIPK